MANNRRKNTGQITANNTIPVSTDPSDTISATSGESTFTTADSVLEGGDWIWTTNDNKLYRVASCNKTSGTIEGTFAATYSSQAYKYVKREDTLLRKLWIVITGADTSVDGTSFPQDSTINEELSEHEIVEEGRVIEPMVFLAGDASSTVKYIEVAFDQKFTS